MSNDEYQKIVKKHTPKENKLKNVFLSFLVGGLIGLFGEIIIYFLENTFSLAETEAGQWLCLIIIILASLFTGLGFFDDWVAKYRAGLIIPTTGFAHSITSSAIDYKKDGLITGIGSNTFKLAGSVIIYGVVSAFILVLIKVIIYG